MREIRCKKCNKMLYRLIPNQERFEDEPQRAADVDNIARLKGEISCKCPRCKELNTNKV